MNKLFPIGIDDFKKLIQDDYYFIDKSRFIMSLIDGHSDVTLITRPRRFGKTLTMSMLRYFFANDDVAANRKLFEKCEIGKPENKSYMSEQGKYPVVFLTLKDINALDYEGMLRQMALIIADLYGQYRFLLDIIEDDEKEFFNKALNNKLSKEEMQFSLKRLTDYLSRYYQEKVIVLIDEYDAPIQHAYDASVKYHKETINFMKGFMGAALKTNDKMKFAVLTGVLRIAKESIFSDLNNLDVCSLMSSKYNDVFGFTTDEVAAMLADYGMSERSDEVNEWYDGYLFGGEHIYNPWSVIQYISNNGDAQPYWINTSSNQIIKDMVIDLSGEWAELTENLLAGREVPAWIDEGIIYDDLTSDRDRFFTMMLTTGYLTIKSRTVPTENEYNLIIPNKEIAGIIRKEVLERMSTRRALQVERNLVDKMYSGNVAEFETALSDFILKYVSSFDASAEGFYHGMMLGILATSVSGADVKSEKESGYGRFDLAIIPKMADGTGVILEFKAADKEADLEKEAKKARKQIDDKKYEVELNGKGNGVVKKYGVAFCGKHIKVV
jgi:hypothetical protein